MQEDRELLTASEAADYMRVSLRTIREWVTSGKLSVVRIGKHRYRISKEDLDEYIRTHRQRRTSVQGDPSSAEADGNA